MAETPPSAVDKYVVSDNGQAGGPNDGKVVLPGTPSKAAAADGGDNAAAAEVGFVDSESAVDITPVGAFSMHREGAGTN